MNTKMNAKRFLLLGLIMPVVIVAGALMGIKPEGLIVLTLVTGYAIAKMYLGFEKKEAKEEGNE